MALPWENDPIVQPAASARQGGSLRLVVPPTPDAPPPARPDQAVIERNNALQGPADIRTSEATADIREYEAANLPEKERREAEDRRREQANQWRTEFMGLPEVREFNGIRNSYRQIRSLADRGDAMSDMGLVFSYMKMLDPGSAVREQEYASAANAAGVPDRIRNLYNNALAGEILSPRQRAEMVEAAQTIYQSRGRIYNEAADRYRRHLERLNENPDDHGILYAIGPGGQPREEQLPQEESRWGAGPVQRVDQIPEGPAQQLTPEQQAAYDAFIVANPNASAQQLEQFAAAAGFSLHNAAEIVAAREAGRGVIPAAEAIYRPPDISDARGEGGFMETADAVARGIADIPTFGHIDEVSAALDTVFGGGTYAENLDRQRAIDAYDQENNTAARIAGQVGVSLFIPTRAVAAAKAAAVSTLRAGGTRAEAIAAARAASGTRLGKEGAAFGAGYGYGSSEGDLVSLEAIVDSAIGAAGGAATGKAVGGLGVRDPRARPPSESAERVAQAERFGIDLPMGSAGGRGSAWVEKGMDILPGSAGVMQEGRDQLGQQVGRAVDNVAGTYGSAETLYAAGDAAQRGARSWISRFDELTSKLYDAIPISPRAQATLSNTMARLDELTTRFQSNEAMRDILRNPGGGMPGPLRRLEGYREALQQGGLSWEDLKFFRSRIGYEIGEQRFSDSPTKDELRALYAALSDDMRATAAAQGPRALRAFERANDVYRQGQERIDDALVRILGDDSKNNPEAAAAAIQAIARSGRASSNLNQLAQIRSSLIKSGEWDEVAGSLIRLAGQPARSEGREFNPQTFVQTFDDMSDAAKNLLFGGGAQRQQLRQNLEEFTGVIRRLAETNAMRNTSNTAGVSNAAAAVSILPAALFNPTVAAGLAGQTAGAYALGRLWTNPKFVKWATGYARMLAGAQRAGNAPDPGAISRQREYLMRLARTEGAIAADLTGLSEALFGSEAE